MRTDGNPIQALLQKEFERRVQVNPRYSLRAYAKALNISSGALSEFLRGQRPVTLKMAVKVAKVLGLSSPESSKLFLALETQKRQALAPDLPQSESESRTLAQTQLSDDTFRIIADWYHFAILNLMDCEGFVWNSSYIAKRLAISQSQARLAMELLLRVGLVHREDGRVVPAKEYVLSPSGVSSSAIRSYHRQILTKAIEALELQNVEQREMNGVCLAVDPKKLRQIKSEISDFLDGLATKYSTGKRQEVYFLETALFQITQGNKNGIK